MTSLLAGLAIGAVTLAAIAVGGCIAFGLKALAATERAATAEKERAVLGEQLKTANANTEAQTQRANAAERSSDALEALIDEVAANDDPDIARAHVLSRRARQAGAADGGDTGAVSSGGPDPRVARRSDDDLLRPGE